MTDPDTKKVSMDIAPKAGGESGSNSGPTGSSRSYPKGDGETRGMPATALNPMTHKAPDWLIHKADGAGGFGRGSDPC